MGQPVNGAGDPWDRNPWLAVTVTEDGVADTTQYWFDAQWRLERAAYPPLGLDGAKRIAYGLRPDGVRLSETTYTPDGNGDMVESGSRAFHYSPLDHLERIDAVDSAGGMTSVEILSDGWGRPSVYRVPGWPDDQMPADREMVWDAEGRMLSLTVVGGEDTETSRSAYNWRDQRIRRQTPGEYVESLWEGDGLLSEAVTVSGTTDVRSHLRGAGMVLAAGGVRLGHDWLGSPAMLGSVTDGFVTRRYDAWGRIVAGDVPMSGGVQVGYTGHAYDPESGLTYAQARYYDPEAGLFLGPDPWDSALGEPGTLSRFVYVGGSPVTKVDPDGRQAVGPSPDEIAGGNIKALDKHLTALSPGLKLSGNPLLQQSAREDPLIQHYAYMNSRLEGEPAYQHIGKRLLALDYEISRLREQGQVGVIVADLAQDWSAPELPRGCSGESDYARDGFTWCGSVLNQRLSDLHRTRTTFSRVVPSVMQNTANEAVDHVVEEGLELAAGAGEGMLAAKALEQLARGLARLHEARRAKRSLEATPNGPRMVEELAAPKGPDLWPNQVPGDLADELAKAASVGARPMRAGARLPSPGQG